MNKLHFGYRKLGKVLITCAVAFATFGVVSVASADTWVANTPESIQITSGQISYELKLGDTLWAISKKINTTVENLAEINKIDLLSGEEKRLSVGRRILLPSGETIGINHQIITGKTNSANYDDANISVRNENLVDVASSLSVKELMDCVDSVEIIKGITHVKIKESESMGNFVKSLKETIREVPIETNITFDSHDKLSSSTNVEDKVFDDALLNKIKDDKEILDSENNIHKQDDSVLNQNNLPDKIHFLRRINEGSDMILVESNGLFGLVDAGYRNTATRDYSIDYLKKLGIKEFQFVWISHYDEDHVVGIDAYTSGEQTFGDVNRNDTTLIDNFKIKHVYLPNNHSGAPYEIAYENNIKKTLEERAISYSTDGTFAMGDFVMTTYNDKPLLQDELDYNQGKRYANLSSRALLVEKDNYDVLMMGDIESYDEKALGEEIVEDTGTVDILKAGHHGYVGSNTKEFLSKVDSSAIIVTESKSSVAPILKSNLDKQIPIYGTSTSTVIVDFTDTSKGISVGTENFEYQIIENNSVEGTQLDNE